MNSDVTHERRLTTSPADDGPISWSPDGHTLAFDTGLNGGYQIDLMNAHGGSERVPTMSN